MLRLVVVVLVLVVVLSSSSNALINGGKGRREEDYIMTKWRTESRRSSGNRCLHRRHLIFILHLCDQSCWGWLL